jgi:thiamine biosynthesis lipoprotein
MGLLLFYFFGCAKDGTGPEYTWHGGTMGTTYLVKISQVTIEQAVLEQLQNEVENALIEVNRQMSTYDPKSEISRFNRFADTTAFEVSPQLVKVVSTALDIYTKSMGAFDVTVAPLINLWGFGTQGQRIDIPSDDEIAILKSKVGSQNLAIVNATHLKKRIPDLQINLSAIAKGYGVDVVDDIIQSSGYQNYMVEIGGEVVAHGVNARHEAWRIGIDRPAYHLLPGEELEAILALRDIAVATSGDYRNYFEVEGKQFSHTIDPATGRPITHGLASATIIAPNCMLADALATAVMVMGREKAIPWIENLSNVEALLIMRRTDGTYEESQTSGFRKYLLED